MSRGLLGVALVMLFGCDANNAATDIPRESLVVQEFSQDQPMLDLWTHSCALCHVDGNAGAPRMGNAEEWGPRLAQGKATLLQHTLDGFNQMPPLGYCMACERADFIALIEFMTRDVSGDSVAEPVAP